MNINMKKWASDIIEKKQRVALPVLTYPGLPLANKTVMDVITNGKAQFEVIKVLAEKYPTAATVTIMDLSVEAECFGSPVKFSDNEVPTVVDRIVTDMETANSLVVPSVSSGRVNVYVEAAKLSAQNIADRPAFGGLIGPFSLAGRLMDMTEVMMALILEPEVVHVVLEKCTQFAVEYCKEFKNAGANGVVIAEPAAGLLSPDMIAEFSSPYVKKIVDAVQDDSFAVVLHNCGNAVELVSSMLTTGAMGYHFGNAIDMLDVLPQIPADKLVFGNIDPANVFKAGTKEEMYEKTTTLLERTAEYKNYVLSSGCDVPPETPLENVEAFYKAVDDYNKKLA